MRVLGMRLQIPDDINRIRGYSIVVQQYQCRIRRESLLAREKECKKVIAVIDEMQLHGIMVFRERSLRDITIVVVMLQHAVEE